MSNILLSGVLFLLYFASPAQLKVSQLKTENLTDPKGIGNDRPRFSWQLEGGTRGTIQIAYEVEVFKKSNHDSVVWRSGKCLSGQSVWISYGGPALLPKTDYLWTVRAWDNHGGNSACNRPAHFSTGIFSASGWVANWILPGFNEDSVHRPAPLFRKTFELRPAIRSATLYITALGLYEAYLNGKKVGDAFFTPGWTNYDKRLEYQVYDVSSLVRPGNNAAGVVLGDGWYRGIFGPANRPNNYGNHGAILYQLEINYMDGSTQMINSDTSWRSSTGPIRYADLYNGEVYDARREKPGWTDAQYQDHDWNGVISVLLRKDHLVPTISPPVRAHESIHPLSVFTDPKGETILDFGQNLAGWVQFKWQGNVGDTVRLWHAETLDAAGNFFTGNLRQALAMDTYIARDDKTSQFAPHFTFHGFRYVKVNGLKKVDPAAFTAIALYSDLKPVGTFTCSDTMLNQLQHNITWSQKSNFLDIPSDCPQRSERLGWTGDAQVFARTAAFNMDCYGFFKKWLQDLESEQGPDGGIPNTIPNLVGKVLHRNPAGTAGWGDVTTILPSTLFEVYGDTALLAAQYGCMKAWVDYISSKAVDDCWTANGYGDWYAPGDSTSLPFIDQCFYAHSTELLIKAARILRKRADDSIYSQLLERIRLALVKNYIKDGRIVTHTQTAYTLALHFGLLPDSLRSIGLRHLVQLIHSNHDRLATGFLGTPYLLTVLTEGGYTSLAYTILRQQDPPSWLYPVKKGATTIWEKWTAIRPDGSMDTCSLNHYAYGAVGDWLYRSIAGIQEGKPGYRTVFINPRIGGGLSYATGTYQSPYGAINSGWRWNGDTLSVDIEIPANTTAIVTLPVREEEYVQERGFRLTINYGVTKIYQKDNMLRLEAGSGIYHFTINRGHVIIP